MSSHPILGPDTRQKTVHITVDGIPYLAYEDSMIAAALLDNGIRSLQIFFFGFFMMAFQVSGQVVFVGLGKSRQAVFFSLLRKAIIVVPLTFILPYVGGLGVNGVFLAEPISNFIGGLACFTTMMCTVYRRMKREEAAHNGK